jgi:hypothetical protein
MSTVTIHSQNKTTAKFSDFCTVAHSIGQMLSFLHNNVFSKLFFGERAAQVGYLIIQP